MRNVVLVLERAFSTMDQIKIVDKSNITALCKLMDKINGTDQSFPITRCRLRLIILPTPTISAHLHSDHSFRR